MVPKLCIIIPCYNEEKVLPITSQIFLSQLSTMIDEKLIDYDSKILFVNDGSTDSTWKIITDLSRKDPHYIGISQSRNRGHQNAVLAGLMEAKDKCDITISIDCDGQDDISAMGKMVNEYLNGNEIVYGVRKSRDTDTFFKRFTAESFYYFMSAMGADIVFNHADYRLMSSKVLQHFADFEETSIFLRGLVPLLGYKSTSVYYDRAERIAGESHYPLKKMLYLAIDGITSLSVKPIRLVSMAGMIISLISFVGIGLFVLNSLNKKEIDKCELTNLVVSASSGVQLLSLGIVGEYVGRTYLETKHRPRYIISERT